MVLLVAFVSLSFGQENWNGWVDTAKVLGLFKDTTIYTGWFKLSQFGTVRHTVYLDDTSAAGFASDSVAAEWGIQTGHASFLTGAKKKMEHGRKMVIDTFNMLTGSVFSVDSFGRITVDVNGIPQAVYKKIDTLIDSATTTTISSLITKQVRSPYAYQSRGPFTEWDVYFRYWIHGLTGNKKSTTIKCFFQAARQIGTKVVSE
jgi:hypothetical protein